MPRNQMVPERFASSGLVVVRLPLVVWFRLLFAAVSDVQCPGLAVLEGLCIWRNLYASWYFGGDECCSFVDRRYRLAALSCDEWSSVREPLETLALKQPKWRSHELSVPVFGLPARLCKADIVRRLVDLKYCVKRTVHQLSIISHSYQHLSSQLFICGTKSQIKWWLFTLNQQNININCYMILHFWPFKWCWLSTILSRIIKQLLLRSSTVSTVA